MSKELYIKGDEELVNGIIEIVRPLIGKDKIWIVDVCPQILPDDLKCVCGGKVELACEECINSGDINHFSKEAQNGN